MKPNGAHDVLAKRQCAEHRGRIPPQNTSSNWRDKPSLLLQIDVLRGETAMRCISLMRLRSLLLSVVLGGFVVPGLVSQQPKPPTLAAPTVRSGQDGIFEAFKTHPLVGLGDVHGFAQEEDFFAALVRDPRFAKDVGNVVVEFGDASEQETIDHYVAGEDVPYEQLRKVWADTAGWVPTVVFLGYMNFYAEVQAVNLTLPPPQHIHVWLGDPPVDWSMIKARADLPQPAERNEYPANLIKSVILAKKRKALIIYGAGHFFGHGSLRERIEQSYPGSLFVVTPYFGFTDKSCSAAFERTTRDWPDIALAFPVRGSALEEEIHAPGCHFVDASMLGFDKGVTEAQKAKAIAIEDDEASGIAGDAWLYLGPSAGLTESPMAADLYLDLAFRKEIGRRFQIVTGVPLPLSVENNPVSPRYMHPYGGTRSDAR